MGIASSTETVFIKCTFIEPMHKMHTIEPACYTARVPNMATVIDRPAEKKGYGKEIAWNETEKQDLVKTARNT